MEQRVALGPAIRVIRERSDLRHGEFAAAIGISPGYLSNIEAGRRIPAADVLHSIAAALDVAIEAITYPVEIIAVSASGARRLAAAALRPADRLARSA